MSPKLLWWQGWSGGWQCGSKASWRVWERMKWSCAWLTHTGHSHSLGEQVVVAAAFLALMFFPKKGRPFLRGGLCFSSQWAFSCYSWLEVWKSWLIDYSTLSLKHSWVLANYFSSSYTSMHHSWTCWGICVPAGLSGKHGGILERFEVTDLGLRYRENKHSNNLKASTRSDSKCMCGKCRGNLC